MNIETLLSRQPPVGTEPLPRAATCTDGVFGTHSAMAAVARDSIAYLTLREGQDHDGRYWEAGVIGHGPHATALAEQTAAQINAWADDHRDTTPTIRLATGDAREKLTGRFVIDKPHTRIALDWD